MEEPMRCPKCGTNPLWEYEQQKHPLGKVNYTRLMCPKCGEHTPWRYHQEKALHDWNHMETVHLS